MSRMITVSLPVTNLEASKAFYTVMGFVNDPQCSGDGGASMVLNDSFKLMLLTHAKWSTFTTRPIPPKTSSEAGFGITCESREAVDAMNKAAADHGGIADINPIEDHGFMYGRDFTDPDGHVWGAVWLDLSAMPSKT